MRRGLPDMTSPQKARILIVDDQLPALKGVSRVLMKEGFETFEASTGAQGLKLAREHRPDLILLDVVLPDMEGTEVCRIIKADKKLAGIHVVLLSGIKTGSDSQADGLDVGADGYIVRPIPNREMLSRVRAMLRLKDMEKRLTAALNFSQTVLDISPVGIATFRPDGSMISANEAMLRIIGLAAHQVPTVHISDIRRWSESGLVEDAREVFRTGTPKRREIAIRHQSGKNLWLDCRLAAFDSPDQSGLLLIASDITEMKESQEERERLVHELQDALAHVKQLSGLLPICSMCKKIRDDGGYWQEIDRYVRDHSDAQFSHGICPDCLREYYPDLFPEE